MSCEALAAAPVEGWKAELRAGEVIRVARLLAERRPRWATFYRELLGPDGIVRQLFPTPAEMAAFEATPAYGELLAMLSQLRMEGDRDESEPTRVITVRLPKSLHETLLSDARARGTSMNQLCIGRLLQLGPSESVVSSQ